MANQSKSERIIVRIGWLFAIVLVFGYFVVISPKPVTARSILRDLQYDDVKAAHLLVLSNHESYQSHLENALLAVEFTTNTWRLLHAYRLKKGVLPDYDWEPYLVHDSWQIGYEDYDHRPTEPEVERFLVREGWFFETSIHSTFLDGKVYSNRWERALGYQPTHPWVSPTKVYSAHNLRIIEIMESLNETTDAATQERLIGEYVQIRQPPGNRRERIPRPMFLAFGENGPTPWRNIEALDQIKLVVIYDESGEPPLFEGSLFKVRSRKVLELLRDLEKKRRWGGF